MVHGIYTFNLREVCLNIALLLQHMIINCYYNLFDGNAIFDYVTILRISLLWIVLTFPRLVQMAP